MAKKKINWVVIKIFNRVIWIMRKDIKDIKFIGQGHNGKNNVNLYQVTFSDNMIVPQCELRNEKIFEEFNKKDLTKKDENDNIKVD